MAVFERLKADLKRLGESDELRQYLASHKGAYFVSAFFISSFDSKDTTPWVIEYYCPANCKVSTFSFDGRWGVTGDDSVFQREQKSLEALEIGKVKFFDGAERAREELGKSFKGESPLKVIVILGMQDRRPTWNVTVFTKSFKVINFRIDSVTGGIKSSAVDNLLSLDTKKKA